MKRLAGSIVVVSLLVVGVVASAYRQSPAKPAGVKNPKIDELRALVPVNGKPAAVTADNYIAFAWGLFIYANTPALTRSRSQPDPSRNFGSPGPVLWQTWKTSQNLYVSREQTPLPWNQGPVFQLPGFQSGMIDGKVLNDNNGNPIVYEVRLNEDAFNYIYYRSLYRYATQMALLQGGQPVSFPYTAIELKASWRVLGAGDNPSHYMTVVVNQGGVQKTMGLTGLHLSSKLAPNWVWTTFEQVENTAATGMPLRLPIPQAVQDFNEKMQQVFAGTPYAYYRLDGVQTDFVQNVASPSCTVNPKVSCLANTQIESYFQGSSSCVTCHKLASIGPKGARFNFWTYTGGDQQGYMGNPPAMQSYVPLDSVWSLREAQ